jgi:hypothetical protein
MSAAVVTAPAPVGDQSPYCPSWTRWWPPSGRWPRARSAAIAGECGCAKLVRAIPSGRSTDRSRYLANGVSVTVSTR